MTHPERMAQVPKLLSMSSHTSAARGDVIDETIATPGREHPGRGLARAKQDRGGLRPHDEPCVPGPERSEAVQRAAREARPDVGKEVLELSDYFDGVWVVETRGSSHIWDLDNMTYTCGPGSSSRVGGTKFDGNAMPITRVQAWPKVGESFLVWFDDPEDPDLLEHYQTSSAVRRILPVKAVAPTDLRDATGTRDEA